MASVINFSSLSRFIEQLSQRHVEAEEGDEDSLEQPDDAFDSSEKDKDAGRLAEASYLDSDVIATRVEGALLLTDAMPVLGSPPQTTKKKKQKNGGLYVPMQPSRLLVGLDTLLLSPEVASGHAVEPTSVVVHVDLDKLVAELSDPNTCATPTLTKAQYK